MMAELVRTLPQNITPDLKGPLRFFWDSEQLA
jgi:hypothetical protein